MPMETDEDKINDADRHIESVLFKEGQDYAERNKRSKKENEGRAESRKRIKAIGVNTNAYGTAIRLIKDLSPRELKNWKADFDLVLKVMGSRQADLFPDEALKAAKREADRKAAERIAADQAAENERKANNPRGNPASGGAGGKINGKAPAKDKTEAKPAAASKPKPTPKAKGGDNVVKMTPGAATKVSAQRSDALLQESIARQAQQPPGQHGDGSAADLQHQEQLAGDQALKAGLPLSQSAQAAAAREEAGIK